MRGAPCLDTLDAVSGATARALESVPDAYRDELDRRLADVVEGLRDRLEDLQLSPDATAGNAALLIELSERLRQDSLRSGQVQVLLGVSRQRLQQLRDEDRLLGLTTMGAARAFLYPRWQFGSDGAPLPEVRDLIAAAREVRMDGLQLHALLTREPSGIEAVAPIEWLGRDGGRERLLAYVRAAGDVGG